MNFKNKAQAATEYLMIVGFITAVIIPIGVFFYFQSIDSNQSLIEKQSNDIVRDIVLKAEEVYYLGEPTKHTMQANFPTNIDSIIIRPTELMFKIKTHGDISDVYKSTQINMQGSLRNYPGLHTITIEAKDGYVLIQD